MSTYRYDPNHTTGYGDRKISELARILANAGVPNVLWAEHMLCVYGIPSIVAGPDFIVPDHLVQTAYDAFLQAGFPPCADPEHCEDDRREHVRLAEAHFDLAGNQYLSIHKKSNLLYEMPDPELGVPAENDPNYMLASDYSLRPHKYLEDIHYWPGRFDRGLYPVKILTRVQLFQTLCNLVGRDYDTTYAHRWRGWLGYLEQYEVLDPIREEDLHPRYRKLFHAMMHNLEVEKREDLRADLHEELLESQIVPVMGDEFSLDKMERLDLADCKNDEERARVKALYDESRRPHEWRRLAKRQAENK